MPRKKARNREKLLTCPITIRISEPLFKRLEKLVEESDCWSIGEATRRILLRKRINCFYRDISMNGPMEELALIRKELKAMGVNINQQTRYFHTSESASERIFYAMKTAELYGEIDTKVDKLLEIVRSEEHTSELQSLMRNSY